MRRTLPWPTASSKSPQQLAAGAFPRALNKQQPQPHHSLGCAPAGAVAAHQRPLNVVRHTDAAAPARRQGSSARESCFKLPIEWQLQGGQHHVVCVVQHQMQQGSTQHEQARLASVCRPKGADRCSPPLHAASGQHQLLHNSSDEDARRCHTRQPACTTPQPFCHQNAGASAQIHADCKQLRMVCALRPAPLFTSLLCSLERYAGWNINTNAAGSPWRCASCRRARSPLQSSRRPCMG